MPAIAQSHATPTGCDGDAVSAALEQLFSRYAALVQQVARQRNLSEDDIDEVFQDVRIRLWRALATGQKIAVTPPSYVYRTAVSAALDLIRRRQARREEEIDRHQNGLAIAATALPDQTVEAEELAARLVEALTLLDEPRRLVVQMHLAGYHRCEIAELLGWTEPKTRNLLYRGLADLRARLEEQRLNPVASK
ncbi:MAG: sigma-70 family RNA polymerase sigma factor [Gemmatimonadota bacterium]|nr:MAG: sigma-70 family RNA polymerase sigma factor [Gemmatimonadota bacterium]